MWNYIKRSNIHVIRAPEEDKRENQADNILAEIMFNTFPIW